jgi:hypothetical protein
MIQLSQHQQNQSHLPNIEIKEVSLKMVSNGRRMNANEKDRRQIPQELGIAIDIHSFRVLV